MPLPPCLGMDCERAVFYKPAQIGAHAPVSEFRQVVEQKSQQRDGLESVVSTLVQQQAMLQGVVELQKELRSIVKEQHEALEKKLNDILEHAPLPAGTAIPGVPSEEEDALEKRRTYQKEEHACALSPGHSGKIYFSNEKLPGKTQNAIRSTMRKKKEQLEMSQSSRSGTIELPPVTTAAEKLARKPISWAAYLITNPIFDAAMGVIIVLNFVAIFCELQWKGYALAYDLNLRPSDADWPEAEKVFKVIEKAFNGFYLFELIVRLVALRTAFCRDCLNVCDGVVVLVSGIDSFVLDPLVGERGSSTKVASLMRLIRILRALRVLRFMRVLRYMGMFSALRVLVKTISMSLDSLIWSMAMIGFIILSAAMLMVQVTAPFIEDEAQNFDLRKWVFNYYGSAARASYSMFEATFSAKWATHLARPLIEDINPWFSVFWILYTVTVNFAVIRVVSALFLKQTMAVAAIDAERMAIEKMKERDTVLGTLRQIFAKGDQLGDGVLHRWEFQSMMETEEVLQMFEQLELEPIEVYMLYDLLSEDDGVADKEEFLSGAMKLKNQARTVDMIQVLHQQTVVKRSIDELKEGLEHVDAILHPRNPWKAKKDAGLYSDSPDGPSTSGVLGDDD